MQQMKQTHANRVQPAPAKGNLGTFAGVFTPSVLTILGIILFLRLGYVVGNAGLGYALIIIGLANIISVLTSVSLAAIATNLKVKGGGDYYLISRTLGVAYGGSIGVVLFLAQSVSIAFYCIGFGEALTAMIPAHPFLSPRIIAMAAVAFLFIFAWLGADVATRFQFVVMGLLFAALVSFYIGGITRLEGSLLVENWSRPAGGPPFWVIFAIFFPAVTGFTQGVSMSGDLRNPGKSLPTGTFMAVGLSIVVYISAAVLLSGTIPRTVLISDYGSMGRVALIGMLIDAGVIAATLSSAMASFLGAPRILQSLAGDRILPPLLPFAKGYGPTDNPRRAVLLSAGIALITIALGNLNVIAPIVSMFFLISYGLLNYATWFEARTASPSFRPRFRLFDYRLSLMGFLACLGVMLAIDPTTGVMAMAILFALYQYINRTAGPPRWADSRRAYHFQRIRSHLLEAAKIPEHARNWRPQLLVLSNEPEGRDRLLRFASWIEGKSGLTTVVKIIEGTGLRMLRRQKAEETALKADIVAHDSNAFPLVIFAPRREESIHTLVQAFGIGPLQANTILLNWPEPLPGEDINLQALQYGQNLRTAFRHGTNIVVFDAEETQWKALGEIPAADRLIDVWWRNDATGRLMLLMAYLMKRSRVWEAATIRLLQMEKNELEDTASEDALDDLKSFLETVRIDAEPEIVSDMNADRVVEYSFRSSLVFLPFRFSHDRVVSPFGEDLTILLSRLPMTALVMAAEDIDLDAAPEEGEVGETTEAYDAHTEALKKARAAQKDMQETASDLETAKARLDEVEAENSADSNDHDLRKAKKAVAAAAETALDSRKRWAKASAKVENTERELTARGIKPQELDMKDDSVIEVD